MALEIVQDTEHVVQCAKCGQFVSPETDAECWNCFMSGHADPEEGFGAVAWSLFAVLILAALFLLVSH